MGRGIDNGISSGSSTRRRVVAKAENVTEVAKKLERMAHPGHFDYDIFK